MPRVLTTSTASAASTTSTAAAARTARASLRFDAHSVLLFALWAGATLAAHDARAQAVAEPAARSAPALGAAPAAPQPASPAAPSGTIEAAFARADANGDGQLTRDEAARYPAVAQAFDGMDTDRSGALSQAEFVTSVRFGAQRSPAAPAPQAARPAGG